MERSLTHLASAVAALAILCWPAPASAADTKQDMRVINTPAEPVPVAIQGTAAVTGGVQVTNTPTVGLDPSQNGVQVTNPDTAPIPVRDLGRPSRQPFQARVTAFIYGGESVGYSTPIPVPANERVVIQHVSMPVQSSALGDNPPSAILAGSGSESGTWTLSFTRQDYATSAGAPLYVATHGLLAYFEPGGSILMQLRLRDALNQPPTYGLGFSATITGYRESVP